VKDDGRSRRVALISDAVLNPPDGAPDVIGALVDAGWGVIALPPGARVSDGALRHWAAGAADQARELARHGMTIVAVLDAGDGRARDALAGALAVEPSLHVPTLVPGSGGLGEVAAFLAAHGTSPAPITTPGVVMPAMRAQRRPHPHR
jgi:hypothetical protein